MYKISLVALFLVVLSCNKDNFQPDFLNGEATAIKNDKAWKGQARGVGNNQGIGFDLSFTVYNDAGELRQDLVFSKIPQALGNYALFQTTGQETENISGCRFFTMSHDGDVIGDVYKVVESVEESHITVLSYDDENRILQGTFEIMLFRDTSRANLNPDNPDMLHFENGEFEVRIQE